MENITSSILPFLISNADARKHLFEMLEVQDLVNLLCLCKEVNEDSVCKTSIVNRLYFLTFLKPREMFAFGYQETLSYKKFQNEKVDNILSMLDNSFIGSISQMKEHKQQITRNLNKIMSENDNVRQIVDDVFESMIDPAIPMPNLRKETVGDYCNSSLQIFIAELNWREKSFAIEEQPYRSFKVELLNNHETILKELLANNSLLIEIRFQSELIKQYTETDSPFLNVIISFLALIDRHLESLKNYLQLQKEQSSFEFLCQFTKRYNTFRDMVLGFEDKLGFMFELFTKAFNYLHPELQIYPGCSLWRTLMKKWVSIMKPFEGKLGEGYTQLLVRMRQRNVEQMLQKQNKLQQCSPKINSNFMMKRRLIENRNPILSDLINIIIKQDQNGIPIILNDYLEYLIDVSVNQYSVHWCQNSSQKLSSIYHQNERLILESTQYLYKNWGQIFEGSVVLKEVYEQDIEYLRNILKPTTLTQIIQNANVMIENLMNKQQKLIKGDFQHLDDRIRNLNEKRMIPLELEAEHKQFFDFDKTITSDKIENIRNIVKNMQKTESCDEDIKIEKSESLIEVEQ